MDSLFPKSGDPRISTVATQLISHCRRLTIKPGADSIGGHAQSLLYPEPSGQTAGLLPP